MGWKHPVRAFRAKNLLVLLLVLFDAGISQIENLWSTAVISLKAKHFSGFVTYWELQYVVVVCAPESVNALRVVTDDHQVNFLFDSRHNFNDFCLDNVGVLIFVNKDVVELVPVTISNLLVIHQDLQPAPQKVVIVHCIGCLLPYGVPVRDFPYDFQPFNELDVALAEQFLKRLACICLQ